MKILKNIISMSLAMCLAFNVYIQSSADTFDVPKTDTDSIYLDDQYYRYDENGRWILAGGVNRLGTYSFSGTTKDAQRLEEELQKLNYICVYGKNKEISSEEFEKYFQGEFDFGFSLYARQGTKQPDEIFYQSFYDIYINRETFDIYKDSIDNGSYCGATVIKEIRDSAVIVSYAYAYSMEKVGKVLDEVNDKIPVWCDTGYLLIKSPIDVKVRTLHYDEQAYYDFYVAANEPYLVKVKAGGYEITELNGKPIGAIDEFLPFDNNIQINDSNIDPKTPYVVDLKKVIEERNVPQLSLVKIMQKDKVTTDYNIYEELKSDNVIVDDDYEEKQSSSSNKIIIVLLLSLGAVLIAACIYDAKERKKEDKSDKSEMKP